MSNFIVALLAALGVGGWVYAKAYRRTGGLRSKAFTAAGVVALLVFGLMLTLLSYLDNYLT